MTDLGEFRGGKTPSTQRQDYWDGEIPWITPKDMKSLQLADSQDRVSASAVADGLCLIPANSVLIVVRSGILRRTVPTSINVVPTTINQDLKALVLTEPELAGYVQLLIRGFEGYILEKLTKIGTTVESIQFDAFSSQPFPFPPRSEQARIVARVDELMRLCDALEAKGRLELEQHARLLDALLGSLTSSTSPEDLATNWQRVAAHFDLLLDRPEAVDTLEQVVLRLAMRGLLSPTRAPDSGQVETVAMRGARAGSAGDPVCDRGSLPELPAGWRKVTLSDVCMLITDGEHATPQRCSDTSQVPLVTAKNVRSEAMDYTHTDWVTRDVAERCWKRCKPADRDILMVSVGATLGRLCVLWKAVDMILVRSVTLIRADERLIDVAYLALHLMAPDSQNQIWASVKQSAQPCLYLAKSSQLSIALPPLNEQRRIVARVEQLRRLCAELREKLTAGRELQTRLADALVQEAVQSQA